MGESKIIVYVAVGILGVAAAALAFAAEATKIKGSDIQVTTFGCSYPNTPANILGYIAALLVLIAQITLSGVTRCACCQRGSSHAGAVVCFVLSWVASAIGIVLLIAAANLSTRQEFLEDAGYCYYVKPGIFATGGGLALFACVVGLSAYSCSSKNNPQPTLANAEPYYQGGIVMGNPQYSTASTNPYPTKQQQYAV